MKKTYQIKTATQCSYTPAQTINHCACILAMFNAWQDLAAEATGHDTEWGYPIAIDCLAQALHISRETLIVLLVRLTQPELELCSNNTAIAFHYPPDEDKLFVNQELSSAHLSALILLEPFETSGTQLITATSIAA
jgi:hypothetical protein